MALRIDDTLLSRRAKDAVQANGVNGWRLANQWIFSSNDADIVLFYAKLPMIALGALPGLFVFCWARELYGPMAALAALAMYVFDPNMLAHSSIIHTDILFALFFFGGTYFFWRTLRHLTWFNGLATAVFLSMAAITKFSFLMIFPIWVILAVIRILYPDPILLKIESSRRIEGYKSKAAWIAIILSSATPLFYLTIWAAYGFRYDAVGEQRVPLGITEWIKPSLWLELLIRLNANYHLVPEAWFSGIIYALCTSNRTAYLLGAVADGFWLYFPIAVAVKTPLPILILLVTSLLTYLSRARRRFDDSFPLISSLLFFLMAAYSRMNIGLRHIVVIYPFLFVWLGGNIAVLWDSRSHVKKFGVLVLAIWLIGSTLKSYPDYLAYFNETVDTRAAHEILVDSNLDWGQDLKPLKRWMEQNAVPNIQLAYFGTADPAYYGIDAIYKTWNVVNCPFRHTDS